MSQSPEQQLAQAIEDQRTRMSGYEIPSEALTLETVRALDHAFCREHMPHLPALNQSERRHQFLLQRGVNEALKRVLPTDLALDKPRVFQSTRQTQEQADAFLLDSALLWFAERLLTQLRAGFLSGRLDPHRRVQGMQIMVLAAQDSTLYHEGIGYASVEWLSDRALLKGRPVEEALLREREVVLPQMTERLLRGAGEDLFDGADQHFHECAKVYLSRMPYRDLLSETDRIGGRPYSDYVKALEAIATLNEIRLCTSTILDSERPHLGIRNLLTGVSFADELVESVATFLDADAAEVNQLLMHLTISPVNSAPHLSRGTPAWAPIVQTSANFCVLPSYGLDMNPFLFLTTELRERHQSDWFQAANAREARWVTELRELFPAPRWRCDSGVKIKRGGKVLTDIDFIAYDSTSKQVALFQLKWQQPSLSDEKVRRNNASSLVGDSNKWVEAVADWMTAEGEAVLAKRLSVRTDDLSGSNLFVLGRYGAHFSGQSAADPRAAWAGWGHLERERTLHPKAAPREMHTSLVAAMATARRAVEPESLMLPLPGLTLVVNPIRQPEDTTGRESK